MPCEPMYTDAHRRLSAPKDKEKNILKARIELATFCVLSRRHNINIFTKKQEAIPTSAPKVGWGWALKEGIVDKGVDLTARQYHGDKGKAFTKGGQGKLKQEGILQVHVPLLHIPKRRPLVEALRCRNGSKSNLG
jgi:hypothetical protein